ncbi:MAG: methyl-accepting chemotaxis protein [Myxococcota bacterium]
MADQVDHLQQSSDQSASSILELAQSIDQVADSTASLHERVDSSTSSVHQMSASIRQVAAAAEQVQEMAETTAASVTQMDRSIQEVSNHALEAATLTDRAREGATEGHEAVRSTIGDIERISTLTTDAMARLDGLVNRLSQIGSILGAIDEINDETNLLSLNAAIIAAQAGEQGKAFLVVANHVKTLARRTAASTQDIERLIGGIHEESSRAVDAMRAGITAVEAGVERSRGAGSALELIQQACTDASERVAEIARTTAEQSRNSKGVAESTQRTSSQIQQISQAIEEQRQASESMLENSESALASCLTVHRATDEQRATSRHITTAIGAISEMIREIGGQTRNHAEASDSTGEAVVRLIDNAQEAAGHVAPLRDLFDELASASIAETGGPSEAASPSA